jgi:hypothetical protein
MIVALSLSGCYKLQKDYKYEPSTLDPNINMTAKDFLLSRGTAGVGSDTVFKWMQLGRGDRSRRVHTPWPHLYLSAQQRHPYYFG